MKLFHGGLMKCDFCKEEIVGSDYTYETSGNKRIKSKTMALPFTCSRCGGTFCEKHRLPERHDCKNAVNRLTQRQIQSTESEHKQTHNLSPEILKLQELELKLPDDTPEKIKKDIWCKLGFHKYDVLTYDGYEFKKKLIRYRRTCMKCGAVKHVFKKDS